MLYDGKELHVLADGAHELVYALALSGTAVVDGAQRVVLYAAHGHHLEPSHHAVEGGVPASVVAVGVVDLFGSVDGESDEEVVLAEEVAPVGVDEQSVGLQRVLDLLVAPVSLLQCYGLLVEVDACQEGLSSVPAEGDGGYLYGLDVLADVAFEQFVAHLGLMASVEVGLAQVVAVVAVEVTERSHGLYHRGKGRGACQSLRVGKVECAASHCWGAPWCLWPLCCMPRRSSRW